MSGKRGQGFRQFMRNRTGPKPAPRTFAPNEKIPVMFAVPSGSGHVNWSIAHQMARMMWNAAQPTCPFVFDTFIAPSVVPVQYARNQIVARFLASPCRWLVMVDEDQVVPDNWWELLGVDTADVVSGTTYVWVGNQYKEGRLRLNQYGLLKRDESPWPECFNVAPDKEVAEPYSVPIVGTGCIAIRRHVLEALGPYPFQFTYKPTGAIMGGEDVNFSSSLNQAGFSIAVHPGVRFGHVKSIDLAMVAEFAQANHEMLTAGRTHRPLDMLSIGA